MAIIQRILCTLHVIIGAWAPYIGEMVNVAVPLIVTKHAYVLTERIEGIAGMPNVRDHDSSIYLKLQGDALSVGGYENDPIFVDQVSSFLSVFFPFFFLDDVFVRKFLVSIFRLVHQIPKDEAFNLYELDWDVFGVHIEGAINRCPILEHTGIKSTICGPESFTPDHKALLG